MKESKAEGQLNAYCTSGLSPPTHTQESIEVPTFKVCSECGKPRKVQDYYKKGLRLDSACKSCINQKKKKRRSERRRKTKARRVVAQVEVEFDGLPDARLFIDKLRTFIEDGEK